MQRHIIRLRSTILDASDVGHFWARTFNACVSLSRLLSLCWKTDSFPGSDGFVNLDPGMRTMRGRTPSQPTVGMYKEQEINLHCFKLLGFGGDHFLQ